MQFTPEELAELKRGLEYAIDVLDLTDGQGFPFQSRITGAKETCTKFWLKLGGFDDLPTTAA